MKLSKEDKLMALGVGGLMWIVSILIMGCGVSWWGALSLFLLTWSMNIERKLDVL
ncbi:MAG: hypothetical protein GY799_21210 [Desulfobulbaceae bacterium]|nr:hypothetical protein [Desulfobulbaceae bacterium]